VWCERRRPCGGAIVRALATDVHLQRRARTREKREQRRDARQVVRDEEPLQMRERGFHLHAGDRQRAQARTRRQREVLAVAFA
jgi:hypothetical protein